MRHYDLRLPLPYDLAASRSSAKALVASISHDLLDAFAQESRMRPHASMSAPSPHSAAARTAVGNLLTRPVAANSRQTGMPSARPAAANASVRIPKKGRGL